MSQNKSLTWNDRLALINYYKPTDEKACAAFGVTQTELDTARVMQRAGTVTPNDSIDVDAYGHLFGVAKPSKRETTQTSTHKSADASKPVTATKKTSEPKKRGRKGDKILKAFQSIPRTPIPLEQFANEYNISVAVLKQSKRFDKCPELGRVNVRKNKEDGMMMIWRDEANS